VHASNQQLFPLPCACQNLRRLTRIVTRIYDQEMRKADIEITQYGLLTALATIGQANQKQLSAGFAIDSTTLTRTMAVIEKQGWVKVERGEDRRERLFSLTASGKRKLAQAAPHWEAAERRLLKALGEQDWKSMHETVARVTQATSSQPE
jgi:DNA-binding MarR family transcriptional regulator